MKSRTNMAVLPSVIPAADGKKSRASVSVLEKKPCGTTAPKTSKPSRSSPTFPTATTTNTTITYFTSTTI